MSFLSYKERVSDGDTVILYLGFSRMKQIKVKKNETYQTQFGAVRHNDIIGSVYGSQIKTSKGWVYILHPTAELWTITLPHRTQILYSTDISMVVFYLDLSPGKIVIESGTGSGSLSHALARSIAPIGHLYTFDFHEQRAMQAKEEFKEHGLGSLVTAEHKDVCHDGFGLQGIADAVFLDLPSPWEVIPHAKRAIKSAGGRICTFSPCIEQVQQSCEALRKVGFREIHTLECLLRDFNIQTTNMATPDLGFERYGENPSYSETENDNLSSGFVEPQVGITVSNMSKKTLKRKHKEKANANSKSQKQVHEKGQEDDNEKGKSITDNTPSTLKSEQPIPVDNIESKGSVYLCKSAAPKLTIPGHTGYLTFATLFPEFNRS